MYYKTSFAFLLLIGIYLLSSKLNMNKNVRNNNPLNIKESADWTGERALNIDPTFEEFKTPEYGFRAGYIILLQYLERGENTIKSIVEKWAPRDTDENNHTDNYIGYIANKMNMSVDSIVYPEMLPELMLYMSEFEGGNGRFTIEQSREGAVMAQRESFVIARLERLALGGVMV